MTPRPKGLLTQLEDKVLIGDGCWEWTAYKNSRGYGFLRNRPAHQVMWELLKGPCPDGLELDHLCRNPGCVRPDHLEWVSHAENMRRMPREIHNHARKTHCVNGHPFDEVNTRYYGPGRTWRRCRACANEEKRRRIARGGAPWLS